MTRLDIWHQLQANGLRAYREIPEASCALSWRRDVRQFKRFIGKQDGFTLDIGCGIEVPGYLDKHNLRHTVGIDPLPAATCFAPMQRYNDCGEDLSLFSDTEVDLVILAGTLDHVLSPTKVLAESRRVLAPTGRIVVQIGIPNNMPVKTGYLRGLLSAFVPHDGLQDRILQCKRTMTIPDGCADEFHFKCYTETEIETLFGAAQLTIARRKRIPGSTFYELRK